jgi:excisionase family DNA binding protein
MTQHRERMLTIAEVADRMGVPRMTVYRMIHAGDLPADRVGATYHVPESALRAGRPADPVAESA